MPPPQPGYGPTGHHQPNGMSAGIMVTQAPKSTSHLFHLIMTLLTFGLWFPIWMIMWIINANSRRRVVTGTQTTYYSPSPSVGPSTHPPTQFGPPPLA